MIEAKDKKKYLYVFPLCAVCLNTYPGYLFYYFPFYVEPVNTILSRNGMQDLNTVIEGRNRQEFFETVALVIFKCVAQLTPQNK